MMPADGTQPGTPAALPTWRALSPDAAALPMPGTGAQALLSWRRLLRHRRLVVGLVILFGALLVAVLAPLLAPYDPTDQNLEGRLINPVFWGGDDFAHLFGTDGLGRDYLSRLIYGVRISLLVAIVSILVSGVLGSVLGIVAGYFGGWVDTAIMFVVTTRLALPIAMVALTVVSLFGASLELLVIVLGLLLWDRFAVVLRNATKQIRSLDYVAAARATGGSPLHILWREVLPNLMPPILVVATFEMAHAILLEAAFSYLGMGVQPPVPSWGLMVAEGRGFLFFEPWLITLPGIAIIILVLAINIVGDGLRDLLSPDARL